MRLRCALSTGTASGSASRQALVCNSGRLLRVCRRRVSRGLCGRWMVFWKAYVDPLRESFELSTCGTRDSRETSRRYIRDFSNRSRRPLTYRRIAVLRHQRRVWVGEDRDVQIPPALPLVPLQAPLRAHRLHRRLRRAFLGARGVSRRVVSSLALFA